MEKVAKIVGQHEMKVYEVATFYTMFNREKRGKHFIQLCGTTPCMVCGSEDIKKTIMDELGVKNGGEGDYDDHGCGSDGDGRTKIVQKKQTSSLIIHALDCVIRSKQECGNAACLDMNTYGMVCPRKDRTSCTVLEV